MQTECPHRKFCRFDPVRDELSPQAARGRKPGQIVQIDRTGVAVEAGFAVKESEAVCPVRVPPVLRRRAERGRPERRAGQIRAPLQRLSAASGARTSGAHAGV